MRDTNLFQMALGITDPWIVQSVAFDPAKKRLDIRINFKRGGTFECPSCAIESCKAYDTVEKTWRHLNFFQHEAYITARVPRVGCSNCTPRLVNVPWARRGSGFTLLFEAMVMALAKEMPIKAIASFIDEHDTRLWRIIHHYVDDALEKADYSKVERVGLDETSSRRGHNYVTLFVDMDSPRVLLATEGKGSDTVVAFKKDLTEHGGDPESITEFCSDMSPSFISGVEKNFPNAHLTFDKFHIMKIINEAVDEVRRQEQKDRPELKRSRYIWLKNPENLKPSQRETLEDLKLPKLNLKTSRAYHIRLNFQQLFKQPTEQAEAFLKKWYFWATHSRLEPIKEAAYTIKRHWDGVLRWFETRMTNGLLEGLNSLIQAAKARARGYRTARNFCTMIYLLAGKLDFDLPS